MAATFVWLLPCANSAVAELRDAGCDSPQRCYEAALDQTPASGRDLPEEHAQAALARLQAVRERHPRTVWAVRAGVLTGLLLDKRQPAEATRLFEAARKDLPVLEDYLRLWEGESWLRQGEHLKAAGLFESIPQVVPGTLLRNRADVLAGDAWSRAGECRKAADFLARAVQEVPREPTAPVALLNLADCYVRQHDKAAGHALFKEIWVRYPQTIQAKEAENRLTQSRFFLRWNPTPDDLYERTTSFFDLGRHEEEVIDTIERFLSLVSKRDPRRHEMQLKLGTALFKGKRYEEARRVFQELVDGPAPPATLGEATVWLARTYVAQGEGTKLLALFLSLPSRPLTAEQQTAIQALVGLHHEEQNSDEEAIAAYQQAIRGTTDRAQWAETLWRIGWIQYRTGQFRDATRTFEAILDNPYYAPQALYWTARALDRLQDSKATDHYIRLCQHYAFTYHCQLAQTRKQMSSLVTALSRGKAPAATASSKRGDSGIARDAHYLRVVELRLLGMDGEVARELEWLMNHYAHDREALAELSTLLSEMGAHQHALRMVRLHFKEGIEQGGEPVPEALWRAAYPTVYLSKIQFHAETIVDPYLVMAIIREESHYDAGATSQVGAVGLMQVMPTTAQALTKLDGQPEVKREELFEYDTNIRAGVLYVEQLLKHFSGNVAYAVAAYNAGLTTVDGWVAKYGHRGQDEFVELIPYKETRHYVQNVLRSYREYRRLGGRVCESGVLDKVC